MEKRMIINGDTYHQKKQSFHELLKKYNLRWKGKFPEFRWVGIGQAVNIDFVRVGDTTLSANITWFGNSETMFYNELKRLFGSE